MILRSAYHVNEKYVICDRKFNHLDQQECNGRYKLSPI